MDLNNVSLGSAAKQIAESAFKAAKMVAVVYGYRAYAIVAESLTASSIRIAREGKMTRTQFMAQAEKQWGDKDKPIK